MDPNPYEAPHEAGYEQSLEPQESGYWSVVWLVSFAVVLGAVLTALLCIHLQTIRNRFRIPITLVIVVHLGPLPVIGEPGDESLSLRDFSPAQRSVRRYDTARSGHY